MSEGKASHQSADWYACRSKGLGAQAERWPDAVRTAPSAMPTAAELRQCPLSCFPFFGPVRSVSGGRGKKRLIYEAKMSSTRAWFLPRGEWHFVARSAIGRSNLLIYQPFVPDCVLLGNRACDAEWHSGICCAAPQSGTKCHTRKRVPQARCLDRAKGNRGPVRAPGHGWQQIILPGDCGCNPWVSPARPDPDLQKIRPHEGPYSMT